MGLLTLMKRRDYTERPGPGQPSAGRRYNLALRRVAAKLKPMKIQNSAPAA